MHQPDASALRAFTRHCHDAFFRAILSDSERANALIHAHWPKALRWMLTGEPTRPIDPALVHGNLRQLRAGQGVPGWRNPGQAECGGPHRAQVEFGPRHAGTGDRRPARAAGAIRREGQALGRSVRLQHEGALVERARSHGRNRKCGRHPVAVELGRWVFRAGHPEDPLRGALAGACIPRHGRHDEHRLSDAVPGG